jgi:hypothetical protein
MRVMRKRETLRARLMVVVGLAVVVSVCTGTPTTEAVASLDATSTTVDGDEADSEGEALLEFAACMRDNGAGEFQDPVTDAESKVEFPDKATSKDDKSFGTPTPPVGRFSWERPWVHKRGEEATASIDALYEFAVCMREQGIDVPDPDPLTCDIGNVDREDPDFVAAYETCGSALSALKNP